MKIFSKDPNLMAAGKNALRLCMIFLPLAGSQAIGAAFFQSLGKAIPALLLSLSRQVLILIPLILILPRFLGLNGIWLSMPAADLVTFLITMSFVFVELKKIPKTSEANSPASMSTTVASSKV